MNSLSKILLFLLICVAVGLGVGAGAQKLIAWKSGVKNSVASVANSETASSSVATNAQPIASDSNSAELVSDDPQSAAQPAQASPAPAVEVTTTSAKNPCLQPTDPNEKNLWLEPVSPQVSIGDYVPANLVPLDEYVPTTMSDICLTQVAAVALQKMFDAMAQQQLYPMITSGFRDENYQGDLREETNTVTNGYSSVALPGHSEHQLGVTVDFIGIPDKSNADYSALDEFGQTDDYAWLVKNAASFGFVQSYQAGQEPITGYIPEPWHWRYVGAANAQAIVDSKTAPILYLQKLQNE